MERNAKSSMSIGEWHEGQGTVQLIQQRGSHWSIHGHTHQGSMVLVPEEALFLMECGALQVLHNGKPLTLQECYHSLLLQEDLTFYQVFASLKRIGFIANKVCLLEAGHNMEPLVDRALDSSSVEHSAVSADCGRDVESMDRAMETRTSQRPSPKPASPVSPVGPVSSSLQLVTPSSLAAVTPASRELSTCSTCPLCSKPPYNLPSDTRLTLLEVRRPAGGKKAFKKSQPGPPDFRVMIARPNDPFPGAEMVKMLNGIQPTCPLTVCVVDGTNLSYYRLTSPPTR